MQIPVESSRRHFLRAGVLAAASVSLPAISEEKSDEQKKTKPLFKISLAQWSLNRAIRNEKSMTNLDFPVISATKFKIRAIEYVNQLWEGDPDDQKYLADLKKRCDDNGVKSLLIMCDRLGRLGDPDDAKRAEAVANHQVWAEAAKYLGCHSLRVNAASAGEWDEQKKLATDGLAKLSENVKPLGLNVIVENHGGLSSNGKWLAETIESVGMDNCGTLPDFGNFVIDKKTGESYDRYKGVTELMPFAKGVSAKSKDFDEDGNEIHTDFRKMLKIVLDAGYDGFVGIEYEGKELGEHEGIAATKKLLAKVRREMMQGSA
ncbi:MAG: sugar phosphate isomerase/epimerase family protein [Verrucomicrobiota bacterium]